MQIIQKVLYTQKLIYNRILFMMMILKWCSKAPQYATANSEDATGYF